MLRLLREIADAGRMVVVATHDERLVPLADGVVELGGMPQSRGTVPDDTRENYPRQLASAQLH